MPVQPGRLFGSDGLKQRPYPRGQQTVRVPVQMHAVFNGQLRGGEGRVDRLHVVEDGTEVLRGPPQDVVEGLPVGLKILEPVFREHGVDLLLVDRRDGGDDAPRAAGLQGGEQKADVFLEFLQPGMQRVRRVHGPAAVVRADHEVREIGMRLENGRIHGDEQFAGGLAGDRMVAEADGAAAQRTL